MPRILFCHILPNVISPLITTYVLEMAHMIGAEANMSFGLWYSTARFILGPDDR